MTLENRMFHCCHGFNDQFHHQNKMFELNKKYIFKKTQERYCAVYRSIRNGKYCLIQSVLFCSPYKNIKLIMVSSKRNAELKISTRYVVEQKKLQRSCFVIPLYKKLQK